MQLFRPLVTLLALLAIFALPALAQLNVVSDPPPSSAVTHLVAGSGNVANASAAASLPATLDKLNYICGFSITSSGSTAAAVVNATIAGLSGGTLTYTYTTIAGVALGNTPLFLDLTPCMPASASNTAITITLPALGAGNTNAAVTIYGYRK